MPVTTRSRTPLFDANLEYDTLRGEVVEDKKYIFERPIVIIAGAFALFQFLNEKYLSYLPLGLITLLFFNLWFSVNRLSSIARIVAYMNLVLESRTRKWVGWETSLRMYRTWRKQNRDQKKLVHPDDRHVYDNLGYYPTLYYLHIAAATVAAAILTVVAAKTRTVENLLLVSLTDAVFGAFAVFAIRKRPSKARLYIELNRVTWQRVLPA